MSTIRPDLPSNLPQANPAAPSAQVKAAQAAFFRAALGEVQAAAPRPQAQPTAQTTQTTQAESPRLPRLGQHLDIRV
ncbi:hypothetical protein ACETK8_01375 [Brevundimonas staleyi]|uniref:Flagellar hook-length control protein FliK n=1 Tax=Brevundimonas staleyi TaxID=74326 RepID=A0ABW0FSR9_9CAUL